MPSLFGYQFNWPGINGPWRSSSGSRNAQRGNLVVQTISMLDSPVTIIPGKLAQTIISGYTVFRSDVHVSERLIHALQGLISAAELGLSITFLFQNEACLDMTSDICTAALLLKYIYTGVLAAEGSISELSKDPHSSVHEVDPAHSLASP